MIRLTVNYNVRGNIKIAYFVVPASSIEQAKILVNDDINRLLTKTGGTLISIE